MSTEVAVSVFSQFALTSIRSLISQCVSDGEQGQCKTYSLPIDPLGRPIITAGESVPNFYSRAKQNNFQVSLAEGISGDTCLASTFPEQNCFILSSGLFAFFAIYFFCFTFQENESSCLGWIIDHYQEFGGLLETC